MRREGDRYYTDESAVHSLMEAYPEVSGEVLGDPCCGDGRMARLLLSRFQRVILNDINPDVQADQHIDAVDFARLAGGVRQGVAWWVSNPPFFAAGDIIKACLETARSGVAMLVRCTFLESAGPSHVCRKAKGAKPAIPCSPLRCRRNGRKWIVKLPPTQILSIPRISFTKDGSTDSAPAWWFLWMRGRSGKWAKGSINVAAQHTTQMSLLPGISGLDERTES